MERQAAYDLLKCFLEKRGVKDIGLGKELAELLAYGVAKGCSGDPNTIFDEGEWRRFGDKLWEATIEEEKTAKKLGKPWQVVMNALKQHQAEQKAAQAVSAKLGAPVLKDREGLMSESSCPLNPATNVVHLPPRTVTGIAPSAPPALEDWPPPLPPAEEDSREIGHMSEARQIAIERHRIWKEILGQVLAAGDRHAAEALSEAFPVIYNQNADGSLTATITTLDWKILSQLRATVSESGIHGEPTRQMLNYVWGRNILLPTNIRSLMRLILTQHQLLLFQAHWQAVSQESVAVNRQPGDPSHGVTLDELLGLENYTRTEAQAILGPDKLREAMRLARIALERVKSLGGIPSYMGIKLSREELFGTFLDRVAEAIRAAGVAEHMWGALLKQCVLQNSNTTTRNIIVTLPGNWSIEEALERMLQVPTGPQAVLVEAVKELGARIKEQALAVHGQVLAALAPLQVSVTRTSGRRQPRFQCYRCGKEGHVQRECSAGAVCCQNCRMDNHSTVACRRGSGNGRSSGRGPRVATQMAVLTTRAFPAQTPPPPSSQPP
ncbi:GAK9 protein, partial [Columbina picui]|nr:GAK9 protein [Columbina picui]